MKTAKGHALTRNSTRAMRTASREFYHAAAACATQRQNAGRALSQVPRGMYACAAWSYARSTSRRGRQSRRGSQAPRDARAASVAQQGAQHQPSTQQQRRRHMHRPRRQHPRRSPPTRANLPLDRAIHAREAAAPLTPNHPQQSGPPRAHCQHQRHPPHWMRMSATSRRRMRRSCARRDTSSLKNRTDVLRGERGARE